MPLSIEPDKAHAAEDARFERTRMRLRAVVLALASERDITTASVAELTRRAAINRSTFYSHAQTPIQLLTSVLSQDLDEVRQRTAAHLERDGLLFRDVTRTTLNDIADHVVRHEGVYGSTSRGSSMYALRVVLAEHVEQSVLTLFQEGFVIPPLAGPESAVLQAAFIAHGVAAAVEAWLRLPPPRDKEMLLRAVESMYPTWYAPRSNSNGHPTAEAMPTIGEIS
jgi:AcrR family transcriptional regulator